MISEQLLQTKLTVPRNRPELVSRPRLIERLNAGLNGKLILVSAPAGFGKTTLITEWISGINRPVAWLSLDEGDNDPALCMEYFLAALRKIKPRIGASALRLFRSTQQFQARTILTDLINDIYNLREDFVLVIDDYHVIKNKGIHSSLDFLLEHMPQNMHLVILSRSDPPLHLSSLRGRGEVTELRAVDLRFNLDEVAEFLNNIMHLNLTPEEIASLDARSEGWIAGLQMAAISLKGRKDTAAFINAFSGSHRNIMDYLFEEVFSQQSADIQSFLLQTAVLEQLTGPLCDAVTGRSNSAQILETMRRDNLFLLSLDNEGRWYRYHPLFAGLLLHNLHNAHPELIPELHERASLWYEKNGFAAQAIEYALAGKNYSLAAGQIIRNAGTTLAHGELATFKRWTLSLPDDIIEANPVLILYQILSEIWLHGDQAKKEETRLQKVAQLDSQGQLKGQILAIQTVLAAVQGETRKSVELAHQALAVIPEDSAFWRNVVIPCLGQFGLLRGELPSIPIALHTFSEAVRMGIKNGDLFSTVLALRRLAETHIAAGHLREAFNCYQRIIDTAVDSRGQPFPLASFGLIGQGSIAREWYDLGKAEALLGQGIRLASGKLGLWQIEGYVTLARLCNMRGNFAEANLLMQKVRQIVAESPESQEFATFIAAQEVQLALRQNNPAAAAGWALERSRYIPAGSESDGQTDRKTVAGYYSSELEYITLARVYLAQGKFQEALKILEVVSRLSIMLERYGVLIEVLILQALAYKGAGMPEKAMESLGEALSRSEPEGYVSIFLDEGAPMAGLLYEAVRHNIQAACAQRLLSVFPEKNPEPLPVDKHSRLAEPLSDREMNVLHLMADGLSNKEIADRLCIELRTVKWHTGNIFSKLSVKNRTQAVARARELEILSR